MFITSAHAQPVQTETQIEVPSAPPPAMPDAKQAIMGNVAFVAFVVFAFYLLLIRPQQKRFKEHAEMLSALKKGDKVVTGGGLVGKVDKFENSEEVIIDLGNGIKVTALRSTIQSKNEKIEKPAKAAKDDKKDDKDAEKKN